MRHILAVLFLALAGAVAVHADNIPYTDPASQGTQTFAGNLALNFTVNSPITVTGLGVFDASGTGMITGSIQVVIFNTVTNAEVTPVAIFSGSYTPAGLGFDVFQAITPVVLGPGSYQVDAVGFSVNGNLNTGSSSGPLLNNGGGLLTFTGASWDNSTVLDDPMSCATCKPLPAQSQQFDAGTFTFTGGTVATPEPGSLILLGTGLLGIVGMARRKRLA